MPVKLALLDRDNTINRMPTNKRYLYGYDVIRLMPSAGRAIRMLNEQHIPVVVASNQQGVALDEYPQMTLASVELYNNRLNTRLARYGAHVDKFYVCPHKESDNCDCRKPKPGLILQALQYYQVAPKDAVLIGNNQIDVDAGVAGGIRAIAVPFPSSTPIQLDVVCFPRLLAAVDAILK